MQSVKPLANEAEYDLALKDINRYLGALVGSPEYNQLETLTFLAEEYEAKHWPISPPDLNPNLEEWCRLDETNQGKNLRVGVPVDFDEILPADKPD